LQSEEVANPRGEVGADEKADERTAGRSKLSCPDRGADDSDGITGEE
jgi:hypothetical protein